VTSYQNPAVVGDPPVTKAESPGKESDGWEVAALSKVTPCELSCASVD
jgi:hypothetical protein